MPFVRSNNARIYYEVRGTDGPPLVLIRGFGNTLCSWNGLDADLAGDHCVVLMDNRGVGRSSSPGGTYTVSTMADDVAAVIDAVGLGPAHVFGTSLGGMIAQELAIRHPERVRSLVLAASTPGREFGVPIRRRGLMTLALSTVLPPRMRASVAGLATLSSKIRRERRKQVMSRAAAISASPTPLRGLIGQAGAVLRHRAGTRLRSVSIPTLVVHGKADKLIDCKNADILVDLIPRARLELWSGHGHDLTTEDPRRLAQAVRGHVGRAKNHWHPAGLNPSARAFSA